VSALRWIRTSSVPAGLIQFSQQSLSRTSPGLVELIRSSFQIELFASLRVTPQTRREELMRKQWLFLLALPLALLSEPNRALAGGCG
jgi:hypothetical protein